MKKIFFASAIFWGSLIAINAQELENKSGFILGVEASFGFSITHEGNQLLGVASIMGGLYGGYQYYFDNSFGIRVLAAIHDGTPIITKFDNNVEISAIPFWIGGRTDLLWDFWRSEQHSTGISIGIEYASETYRSREAKIDTKKNGLNQVKQQNIYPILGFYYHYKNTQISLDYRFEGALKPKLQTDTIDHISVSTKYTFNESLNLSYTYRF